MTGLVMLGAALGAAWLLGTGDAAANVRAAVEGAPADLLGVLLGATVGLYGRDRVRLRRAYASPSLAWLGKRLLLGAAGAAAVYLLSPVAWPRACLDVFAAFAALGGAVWLGNLPSRL